MSQWEWILLHRSGKGEIIPEPLDPRVGMSSPNAWPVSWVREGDTFTLTPQSKQLSLEELWQGHTA